MTWFPDFGAWINAHAIWPQLPLWSYALIAVLDTHVTTACVTLYLHRCQTHRSITFHPAVHEVVRRPLAVLLDHRVVVGGLVVQASAEEDHPPDAVEDRTMRILGGVDVRVMAAVHRDPLPGRHRGPHPQPETHEMRNRRMEGDAAVGLAAVQVERHAGGGDVSIEKRDHRIRPQRQMRPDRMRVDPRAEVEPRCHGD